MEKTDQPNVTADACPDCHALVADLEAHKRWHRRIVADIAIAVEKENERRSTATP